MFLESGRRQGKCGKILMGSGHISAAQTVVLTKRMVSMVLGSLFMEEFLLHTKRFLGFCFFGW